MMQQPKTAGMQREAAQYRREGYFVARQLLPVAQVERVFAEVHRLAAQQLAYHGLPHGKGESVEAVHRDLQALFSHDQKAYLATLTLSAKLTSLYALYLHPNVQAFAAAIGIAFPVFQTSPVLHLMSQALKIPDGYHGLGAHQDWPTLQGSLDTVTIWMPLVDIDRRLYTMQVIPGSHARGLCPATRREHFFEVNPECYDVNAFVPIEAARGDVVFMSCFTIHRSSPEGDGRLRVSASWRYENAAEPHFIERAYPFAQKRSVVRELITPDFPSAEQVRKAYE